jgi:hypothetical protein
MAGVIGDTFKEAPVSLDMDKLSSDELGSLSLGGDVAARRILMLRVRAEMAGTAAGSGPEPVEARYNPAQLRDPHSGEWAKGGGAVRTLVDAARAVGGLGSVTYDDGSYLDWTTRLPGGGHRFEAGGADGETVHVDLSAADMVGLHSALTAFLTGDQESTAFSPGGGDGDDGYVDWSSPAPDDGRTVELGDAEGNAAQLGLDESQMQQWHQALTLSLLVEATTVKASMALAASLRKVAAKFNKAEPRVPGGEHGGEWTATGAIKDVLKLAGKIELADGEKLLGSNKIDGDQGTVRLALVGHGDRRSLRMGIGGAGFGGRSDGAGPWRGGPDRTAETNAEQKRLRDEQDAIGKELDRLDADPHADPGRKAALRKRFDEIDDMGTGDVYASGYTAKVDPAGSARLQAELSAALDAATKEEKRQNKVFDEIERLDAQPGLTDAEQERLDALQAEADGFAAGQYVYGEGTVPGEWADVHWRVVMDDDLSIGTQVELGAMPHGSGFGLGDLTGDGRGAILDPAETRKLLRMLGQYAGPAVQAAAGVDTHPGGEQLKRDPSIVEMLDFVQAAAGHDVTPGHDELHHYWTKDPEGLAKWVDSPKPWTTLVAHLTKHVGRAKAKVFASRWFIEVFGYSSGSDLNRVAHGHPPRGKRVGPG